MRARSAFVLIAVGLLALSGCSAGGRGEPARSELGLAVARGLPTYNPSTLAGAASAAPEVLARVLPGFSYHGPAGTPVSDIDIGTVTELTPEPLTLLYTFNPAATWSDGELAGCSDVVLAQLAHSGAAGFAVASTAGYADIAAITCAAGDRSATVTFAPNRAYPDWRALFGAGDLLPAHVVERATGVPDVVAAVRSQNGTALASLARFWSTGWRLTPGAVNSALLPALGPYRVEDLSLDGVLTLVANGRWWGAAPLVARVKVRLDTPDPTSLLATGVVQVADVVATGDLVQRLATVPGVDVTTENTTAGEEMVLDVRGGFADRSLRTAWAQCVPRAQLVSEQVLAVNGASALLDTRLTVPGRPDSTLQPQVVVQDVGAAKATVARLGRAGTVVRVGYQAPDPVRARAVELIAQACGPAGFVVTDVSTPALAPAELGGGAVDVLLTSSSASTVPAVRSAAYRSGSAANISHFSNARVDEVIDALAGPISVAKRVALCTEAEALLWSELPSVPLHLLQRTTAVATATVAGVVPSPASVGVGWNIDRWVRAA